MVSLSNVGDALLTLPALQRMRNAAPDAACDVIVGPRAAAVFQGDPRVRMVCVYDKHAPWGEKLSLLRRIRRERYTAIIDLRRTLFGPFGGARFATMPWSRPPRAVRHMRARHMWFAEQGLRRLGFTGGANVQAAPGDVSDDASGAFWIGEEDRQWAARQLADASLADRRFVVTAPGARSDLKRWREEGFAEVLDALAHEGIGSVLVGDASEESVADRIRQRCDYATPANWCGRTTLRQLGALMQRAAMVLSNDSAPVHLAGVVGAPALVMFGPTDPLKYGPCHPASRVVHADVFCRPCEQPRCAYHHECMRWLDVSTVLEAAYGMLGLTWENGAPSEKS